MHLVILRRESVLGVTVAVLCILKQGLRQILGMSQRLSVRMRLKLTLRIRMKMRLLLRMLASLWIETLATCKASIARNGSIYAS